MENNNQNENQDKNEEQEYQEQARNILKWIERIRAEVDKIEKEPKRKIGAIVTGVAWFLLLRDQFLNLLFVLIILWGLSKHKSNGNTKNTEESNLNFKVSEDQPTKTTERKYSGTLKNSSNFLIKAVQNNNLGAVKKLLKIGVLKDKIFKTGLNFDKMDKEGRTALTVASYNGNIEIVSELLKSGAGVNKPNKKGETPVMKAAENGKIEVVRELLKKRGRIDYADEKGETAVMKALENGHTDLSKELIWKGIEIDKTDKLGRTLLMIASQKGNIEIVQLLLVQGADAEKADINGETSITKAEASGYIDIVQELKKKR